MAKRRTKCVYCGWHETRKWKFCAHCGEQYRWQRPAQLQYARDETWKQVVALCLLALLIAAIAGCQSPQRIPDCTRSLRLTEAWGFQMCMTGPWDTLWIRGGAAMRDDKACGRFNVLVLPRACEVFDADGDGDVDLKDWAMRNGSK